MISKIRYRIQKAYTNLKIILGHKPEFNPKDNIRVVVYHGITSKNPTKYNSRFISLTDFESHLNYFKNHPKINLCSVSDISSKNIDSQKLNIALTFDDGFHNNFKYAIPLLEKMQISASFCVTNLCEVDDIIWCDLLDIASLEFPKHEVFLSNTAYKLGKDKNIIKDHLMKGGLKTVQDFKKQLLPIHEKITKNAQLDDYWKLMSDEELKSISKNPLFEVIPHGANHLNLSAISLKEATEEIVSSINLIKSIGSKNNLFCLAFGFHNKAIEQILASNNVKMTLGLDSNTKEIQKRFGINPHINWQSQMHFIFKGKYT